MTNTIRPAITPRVSRLTGAFDFAREDLARFKAARNALSIHGGDEDDIRDADDEIAAAEVRLQRARMSLEVATQLIR